MYIRARFYVCCIDLKITFGQLIFDQYKTIKWALENNCWYVGFIHFNISSMSHYDSPLYKQNSILTHFAEIVRAVAYELCKIIFQRISLSYSGLCI